MGRVYSHQAIKAIVHHGGGNTFNDAIVYGLPQLIIPQWLDCFDYAVSVEQLGLGLQTTNLGPELDDKEIAAKVITLLQRRETIADTVKIWQAKAKTTGGAELAARIIIEQAKMQATEYAKLLDPGTKVSKHRHSYVPTNPAPKSATQSTLKSLFACISYYSNYKQHKA